MSELTHTNRINRRQFLKSAGIIGTAVTVVPGLFSFARAMETSGQPLLGQGVFYAKSKPVFLIAASMDYFRIPAELWKKRLLQAKRGGVNCIASYIAWNWHELEDGKFTFAGDHDLGRFIDICGELGLYFFARVGPFICDEWEAAAHPAWLIGQDDIQFRSMHEPTLKYVRRWFEQLVPIIAERQITKGGPVILVQQENEYFYYKRADGKDYQKTLFKWLRELGIEVTISDCNGFDNRIEGSLQTINGFQMDGVHRFREDRPELPVMISEHYTDYMDCWGWPDTAYPATDQVEQQTMEMLASRVMYTYFVYNSGTNFGFMAATTWKTDDAFCTTTYYQGAPLAEGGALNPMFYACKSADILGMNFQEFFCKSQIALSLIKHEGPVKVSALKSESGYMIFMLPNEPHVVWQAFHNDGTLPVRWSDERNSSEEIQKQPGILVLPTGEKLEMAEGSANPIMVPFDYQVSENCKIDFANATLMGLAGSNQKPTLVFRGQAGRKGVVSINGRTVQFEFGFNEPSMLEMGNIRILGLSRQLANNAWFPDGRLIIGPAYVGEKNENNHECWFNQAETLVQLVEKDGKTYKTQISVQQPANVKIRLAGWKSYILPEIRGEGEGWKRIDEPVSLEKLGAYYGYAWYRASFHSEKPQTTTIQFTIASDRFHIFQKGKARGVWGRGEKATRGPIQVELTEGTNEFVFLCDNMGRNSEGRANDRKGILGPVAIGSHKIELEKPEIFTPPAPPIENYEFTTYHSFTGSGLAGWARDKGSGIGLSGYAWTLPCVSNERFIVGLRWISQYAWLLVNGRVIGEHGGDLSLVNGFSSKEFLLPEIKDQGVVRIELVLYGKELKNISEHVNIYSFSGDSLLSNWQFKLWEKPEISGKPVDGTPIWWECDLPKPQLTESLFLYPEGMRKGQAYINDKALGRFWEIGPQKNLYMPEPWWKESNRIAIFDEEGRIPEEVYIERDSRAPFYMKLI